MEWLELPALGLACLSLLYWTATVLGVVEVHRRIHRLPPAADSTADAWPLVSVVVPACNEVASLEASLIAYLASDYPQLELVVVDDRSSDGTVELLDRLALAQPRLRVVHLRELPAGWLGKVHALHQGLQHAQGEWILFSDADVRQAPDTLRRAMAMVQRDGLDLLTAMPLLRPTGWRVDPAVSVFARTILAGGQAWNSRDKDSRIATGLGAFVLVRRAALERAGGLEQIRLEVADDMALAALVKGAGGRCDVVLAREAMDIALYPDWAALRSSMDKGGFAIIGRYSLLRTLAMVLLLPLAEWGMLVSPAVDFVPGLRWACAVTTVVALLVCMAFERWLGRPVWLGLLAPLGSVVLAALVARSGYLAWRRGGIQWRSSFYPTAMLRAGTRHTWP